MFGRTRVTMRVSFAGAGLDLVAGESYRLRTEQADRMILKGYGDGKLSREYSGDEINAIRRLDQAVGASAEVQYFG